MRSRLWLLFALLLAGWLQPATMGSALAGASAWSENPESSVRLISDRDGLDRQSTLTLGLQFKLPDGWKIYWRSPGDAGFPPNLDWQGSSNLKQATITWPVPHRFSLFGLETFGYANEVVLPIEAEVEDAHQPLALRTRVAYLVCSEICVPHASDLRLDLPATANGTAKEGELIRRFQALVPADGTRVGLRLEQVNLSGPPEAPSVEVRLGSDQPLAAPDVIVEGPPGFSFAKPDVELSADRQRAVLRLASLRGPQAEGSVLEGKRLTLTVFDGTRALEQETLGRFLPASETPGPGGILGFATILGLAILGGLILNLMPCVLPVLSIKLLSVVSHGGSTRSQVRLGFLASAAGIITSILALAAALVALKASGTAVGWGIQFQQPIFLAIMALVVVLFACNLFGFFEILLPARLGALGLFAPGSGNTGLGGHFVTGAFATLLATPCSAPFLGTAVGFALAQGPAEIFSIFLALGLGLALPYLAVAAFPSFATRLPRPGPWMTWLRRFLGLLLLATAIWLLSVIATQLGPPIALTIAALLLALILALGLLRGDDRRRIRRGLATLVAVLALVPAAIGAGAESSVARVENGWETFEEARIQELVAGGNLVFVDVTADWCLTCQVNKRLVLDQGQVRDRLDGDGIISMRADWTSPDPIISDYLKRFQRYGIPFNAVYGPGAPQGLVLPELLTEDTVLAALDEAAGGNHVAGQ